MRDTKFRAWDPFNEVMYYSDYQGSLSSFFNQVELDIAGDNGTILMQYAGLHDLNDKEIYEGDIVRFSQHHNDSEYKADITFMECSFTAHYHKSETIENWISLPLNDEDQETMEVIGNIYENPELLK